MLVPQVGDYWGMDSSLCAEETSVYHVHVEQTEVIGAGHSTMTWGETTQPVTIAATPHLEFHLSGSHAPHVELKGEMYFFKIDIFTEASLLRPVLAETHGESFESLFTQCDLTKLICSRSNNAFIQSETWSALFFTSLQNSLTDLLP